MRLGKVLGMSCEALYLQGRIRRSSSTSEHVFFGIFWEKRGQDSRRNAVRRRIFDITRKFGENYTNRSVKKTGFCPQTCSPPAALSARLTRKGLSGGS